MEIPSLTTQKRHKKRPNPAKKPCAFQNASDTVHAGQFSPRFTASQSIIEITAGKSKTRQRRLVTICPALASWLQPYRNMTTGKLWPFHEITFQEHFRDLCERAKVTRKSNGLRHSFCTYHFALHANENLTAAQAGNSPAMIHGHYKGMATKAEAKKWFAVKPPKGAGNVILLDTASRQQAQ